MFSLLEVFFCSYQTNELKTKTFSYILFCLEQHEDGKKVAGNDASSKSKTIRQNVNLFGCSLGSLSSPYPDELTLLLSCLSFQSHSLAS
jgi:hypothetical protein